jgi:hypothetical protein
MGVPRDLRCRIQVVRPDGSKIPDGGVIWAKPAEKVSIEFYASNDSKEPTKFFWRGVVTYHGSVLQPAIPAAQVNLKATEQRLLGKQTVSLQMPQSEVRSQMKVDLFNLVAETDETNNVAHHQFTPTLLTG